LPAFRGGGNTGFPQYWHGILAPTFRRLFKVSPLLALEQQDERFEGSSGHNQYKKVLRLAAVCSIFVSTHFMSEQPVKSAKTDALRIAYVEYGLDDGWPVILSHGFPYDVHAFDEVAPILAQAGARVILPYTRGFGLTRFVSDDVGRVPLMTCQGMDSPQTPHRDAELLRYLHLRRAGPMEAIPVGVLPGQLSRSLVNPVPVSRLLLWSPSEEV
jgi:hypothetical protein